MLVLIYLSSLLVSPTRADSPSLERMFVNTIKRWNINIASDRDRRERWNRFKDFKAQVDQLTPYANLKSLNAFSVTNNAEYQVLMLDEYTRNQTFYQPGSIYNEPNLGHTGNRRSRRALAGTSTYWIDLGLPAPGNQGGCGSCWSFPLVGAIEGVYKNVTGEEITLSQQYIVDCTFTYSGCAGGEAKDGYKILRNRQYIPTNAAYPYKGYWSEKCNSDSKISSMTDNGMPKMWFQQYYQLSATETAFLGGLVESPVVFGFFISNNFGSYSGGLLEDTNCASDHLGHSMLLVGYTATEINVKASYGTGWGENGYVRYKRGSSYLAQCEMYKFAYTIHMTPRKDIEYKAFVDQLTRPNSRKACKALNTGAEYGWDLAVIPTACHQEQVVAALLALAPTVESDDTKNYAWTGLQDPDLDGIYQWVDKSSVLYWNNTLQTTDKFGMINKNTGKWSTKGSTTMLAYRVCSKFVTCWDITNAVGNGTVSFDKSSRENNTVATVTCNSGATLNGASKLYCNGGSWDPVLPTCTYSGTVKACTKVTVASATISPAQPVMTGAKITIACTSGYTLKGDNVLTCLESTSFDKSAPTCEKDTSTCDKPTINGGSVSPSTATIAIGAKYTVTCDNGNTMSGSSVMTCTDGTLSTAPTCAADLEKNCTAPSITNGTVSPLSSIESRDSYTVTCLNNTTMKGGNVMTCSDGTLSTAPTCVSGENDTTTCDKPTINGGSVSPSTATIATGAKYTVTCDNGNTMSGSSLMTCTDSDGSLSTAPTCAAATTCEPPSIAHGTVSPSVAVKTTESFTLTCGNNYKSSTGSNSIVCDSGTLTTTPECVLSTSCLAPTVTNGVVSPDVTILASGSDYTVKCNPTFTLTGSGTVTCSSGGLSTVPTCVAGRTSCDAPDIGNGTLSPSASIASGEKYTVDCRSSDYTLMGDAVVNCTDGVLTTLPTCDPTAQCLVPDVGNATISPSTPTTTNTNFTVTCNKYFTISGSHVNCTIKDNVAKASTSPTCVPDKCNAATLSVSSGTIKSGQKSEYNFGDKVEWQCNADFELDGNTKVMCIGDTWSSEMPTCKAINKKCTTYDVSNGKLKNAFPYITGDTVQAVCKSTYMVDGTNPITCKATGWSNDPQKCSKNDGTNCKTLVAPKNGNLTCDATTYTAGTKCTVACNTDYVSLSSLTETTCSSVIVWSHETSVNSLAEFAPCIAVIAPKARKLKSEVKMVADYCKTNAEKTKVETALTALLKETLKIPCLVNSKCSVIDYSCDNEQSTKIAIQFTLSQTQDLIDTTLISEAKTMISSSVSGTTFTLSITENRKRATTEMTADNNSFVTSTAVTCESNEVVDSTTGNCVKCPAGYYQSNAACVACPINTYNAAEGAISCQDCADGKLTYGQGSTSSDQCTSLCAVPTISNGKLNYFSGSNVEADTSLTLTCDTGYTTTTATWYCSANAGQTCNALPKNERCGSLSHANSTLSAAHPYFTGQVVNITCAKDYEIKGESSALVICEEFAWNSTRTECKKPGLSEAWKIVIIVVVCVVVLLLILIGAGLLYKNTGKGSVGPHSNHPSKKAHIEDVEYELPDQEQPGTLSNYYNNLVK